VTRIGRGVTRIGRGVTRIGRVNCCPSSYKKLTKIIYIYIDHIYIEILCYYIN